MKFYDYCLLKFRSIAIASNLIKSY